MDESHSPDGADHSLSCIAPGTNACDWTTPPPRVIASGTVYEVGDILQNVESLITTGELIGSYTINNEISVSWTGFDPYNYEVTVTDNE